MLLDLRCLQISTSQLPNVQGRHGHPEVARNGGLLPEGPSASSLVAVLHQTYGMMGMQESIYEDSRPLTAAESPALVVVVAPGTVSEAEAQVAVDELASLGLAVEVAEHTALSRRGAEQLLELHFLLTDANALAVFLGVVSTAVWDGVKTIFRRLLRRAESVQKVTVVIQMPGHSDVFVEATGEKAVEEVINRLPETLQAMV